MLDAAGQFGLAPLSGSSRDVGVTGYTLGGGVGWLARKYGFAADSVIRAEVVTADGRVVPPARTQPGPVLGDPRRQRQLRHRHLAGVPAVPGRQVYAGIAYFAGRPRGRDPPRYRDWAATIPNELSTAVLLRSMPDSSEVPGPCAGSRALVIKAMYAGEPTLGRTCSSRCSSVAGPRAGRELPPMQYGDAAMGGTPARYLDLFHTCPTR